MMFSEAPRSAERNPYQPVVTMPMRRNAPIHLRQVERYRQVEVYDAIGRVVLRRSLAGEVEVDVEQALPVGYYVLRLVGKEKQFVQGLLMQ